MFKPSLKLLLKNILFECAKYVFTLSDDSRENIWYVAVAKREDMSPTFFLSTFLSTVVLPMGI